MKIIGTGSAHPKCAVSNEMLEKFLETTDEWITERTGIKERCVISSEKLEDMATEAANRALEDAGLTAADIDFIICSNVVNEYVTPAMSCIIQGKLGAKCPTVDINAACAGFIYAMDMAEDKLQCKKAKNILIVCAEEPSRMVSWQNRSTCVLFGDGAGAAVVTEGDELKAIRLTTESLTDVLYYQRRLEPTPYISKEENFEPLVMRGREVFKHAVSNSNKDIKILLEECGLTPNDIKYYVLHQANKRIIDSIRNFLGVDEERVPHNVERYGNISSAALPALLDELNRGGKLHKGDKLVFSAFGAGFTTGACVIEWAK
ncbi:MAG: ketoacyl-ACP synthase III [Alistipes sp.]|nr:ketoacyl-ACP synthase III [Alistipes sp.]MBR3886936.1 ketoacyl-ACP synthase III [Alistipes sp.]